MSFNPMPSRKAVEIVEQAGIGEASSILADFALAGLVKSYAKWIETCQPNGNRNEVRDSRIGTDLWRRIIEEEKVAEALGGSVRLEGSRQAGGRPAVAIVDIRFDDGSLRKMVGQHVAAGSHAPPAAPTKFAKAAPKPTKPIIAPAAQLAAGLSNAGPLACPAGEADRSLVKQPRLETTSEKVGIPAGAVTVTVAQAMVALGLGRTTIDKMMKTGVLTRVKVVSRTLITVDSIRAVIASQSPSATD